MPQAPVIEYVTQEPQPSPIKVEIETVDNDASMSNLHPKTVEYLIRSKETSPKFRFLKRRKYETNGDPHYLGHSNFRNKNLGLIDPSPLRGAGKIIGHNSAMTIEHVSLP